MTTDDDPTNSAITRELRIVSLFSGYGGLDMGIQSVLGGQIIAHVDNDFGAAAILAHHWPDVPNLGDITTANWHQLAETGPVDVLTGGFPCQDVSAAGRRAGLMPDSRSGLWTHMARAIAVLRPKMVVIENVRGLLSAKAHRDVEPGPEDLGDRGDEPVLRALGAVLGDLAQLGYDASWCGLRAADVGAPHARYRVFVVATDTTSDGRNQGRTEHARVVRRPDVAVGGAAVPDTHGAAGGERRLAAPGQAESRGTWPDAGRRSGTPAADTDRKGSQGRESEARPHLSARRVATHTESVGLEAGNLGSGDTPQRSVTDGDLVSAWGSYGPAIGRWQHVTGRHAPEPTVRNRGGNDVLNPVFVEWLMGLPSGHVTDVPGLTRNEQLRALGNGVVPQQAAAAVAWLLGYEAHEAAA